MSSSKPKATFWISTWWPVALAVAVICCESTDMMGADHTTGPIRQIYEALFGHVPQSRWDIIHHYVRKTGHFVGYGLVGLAWLRAWRRVLPSASFIRCAAFAVFGAFLVASGDEWHQSHLPNRTGVPSDVLLDTCGALILIIFDYLLLRLLRCIHQRKDAA
jgi:VanZ family protein